MTVVLAQLGCDDMRVQKKYCLQAKRPNEEVFTDWCQTDNPEVVKRNIKIIESYGYQWKLRKGTGDE